MAKKKQTFEQALEQLTTLAEQIEKGEIGLEESIARYEEGMKLIQYCRHILTNCEHKIETLQKQHDGALTSLAMQNLTDETIAELREQ